MNDRFLHPDDCVIERKQVKDLEIASVTDGDGDFVWTFNNNFTDEQIKEAVMFADHAYKQGVKLGAGRKVDELRHCLNLPLDL